MPQANRVHSTPKSGTSQRICPPSPNERAIMSAYFDLESLICDINDTVDILLLMIDRAFETSPDQFQQRVVQQENVDRVLFCATHLNGMISRLHGDYYEPLDGRS
jgi:hypothetical protein